MGRPTKYREEYVELAFNYCLLGATDEEIAGFFQVPVSTFYRWRQRHAAFREALTRGKDEADARVARSLYQAAIGYERVFTKANGEVMREKLPPDVRACTLWLKNRQPQRWRDSVRVEHDDVREADQILDAAVERERRLREEAAELVRQAEAQQAEGAPGGTGKPH